MGVTKEYVEALEKLMDLSEAVLEELVTNKYCNPHMSVVIDWNGIRVNMTDASKPIGCPQLEYLREKML